MREFNWLTISDMIDVNKEEILAKYLEIPCQVVVNVCNKR